jgi:competence protein ComEA
MKHFYQLIFGVLIGLFASGLILLIAKPQVGDPISLSPPPTPTTTSQPKPTPTAIPILVQIAGEVHTPGMYELPQNARLGDLLAKAGGLTEQADQTRVNSALIIKDGDYIYIPSEGQEIPDIARNASLNVLTDPDNTFQYPININNASLEALESLPGIGPAKAADILEYRQMIGEFTSLDELLNISGIGPATLESLLDYLICEP